MIDYKAIAETNQFIVLDRYTKCVQLSETYQSEYDLEREFIADLENQGYEYLPDVNTPDALLANVRQQLQTLNKLQFSESEWQRFVETFLDRPSETVIDKTRKIHNNNSKQIKNKKTD